MLIFHLRSSSFFWLFCLYNTINVSFVLTFNNSILQGATIVGIAANNIARLDQSTAKEETGVFR